jgi:hypothetical protein
LQQLANQTEFKKEKFMEPANNFLSENLEKQNEFFENISKNTEEIKNINISEDELLWSLYNIHDHFYFNIKKHLDSDYEKGSNYPIHDLDKLNQDLSDIDEIIKNLGSPPKLSIKDRQNVLKSVITKEELN